MHGGGGVGSIHVRLKAERGSGARLFLCADSVITVK